MSNSVLSLKLILNFGFIFWVLVFLETFIFFSNDFNLLKFKIWIGIISMIVFSRRKRILWILWLVNFSSFDCGYLVLFLLHVVIVEVCCCPCILYKCCIWCSLLNEVIHFDKKKMKNDSQVLSSQLIRLLRLSNWMRNNFPLKLNSLIIEEYKFN